MAALLTIATVVTPAPLVLRVLAIALFGGGGLVMLFNILSRKVALQVDQTGVTLGGAPLRYRATTLTVPWGDIAAVVLWRQQLPPYGRTIQYVGVQRRPGASPVPSGRSGRAGRAVAGALVPHVPADIVATSRAVNGWRLDIAALAAAVSECSPGMRVVDLEAGAEQSGSPG